MSERFELFDVTVAANTAIATPQTNALSFNLGIVNRIEILVPPGPSGLVGFRIRHSGETVIPYDRSRWIVANDEVIKWDTEGFPVGNAWAIEAYNTDVFNHTLYLRFLVSETRRSLVGRTELVAIAPGGSAEDFGPSE